MPKKRRKISKKNKQRITRIRHHIRRVRSGKETFWHLGILVISLITIGAALFLLSNTLIANLGVGGVLTSSLGLAVRKADVVSGVVDEVAGKLPKK